MARLESVAVAGYYATPPHLVPRIARLLTLSGLHASTSHTIVLLDPCAGEGAAIVDLTRALGRPERTNILSVEMEKTRYLALKSRLGRESSYHADPLSGDAFRVAFAAESEGEGASLLYLNPPYDTDRVHGRMEQRFLDRFAGALAHRGVLVFVVPHYALAASADQLAREFDDLQCFRFPDADFAAYKQVVLLGVRRENPLLAPNRALVDTVLGWSHDPSDCPVLPAEDEPIASRVPVPAQPKAKVFSRWAMQSVDVTSLLRQLRAWAHTIRGGTHQHIESVRPNLSPNDLMQRVYPLAVPPRPAHIAAGMASGIFNGARIEPDDPKSNLPPLLVKGVFDREYKTIETKHNKDGEVTGHVQVQQPKMVVTVLDLSTYRYHTLRPGAEPTDGKVTVETMTIADLLDHYPSSLMAVMERQCPVLYDPRYDSDAVTLAHSPRKLFTAQAHAARACVRLLENDQTPVLLGEIGSGKTSVAVVAARSIGSTRICVLCPPHLLEGWPEQLTAIAPDCDVYVLKDVVDLQKLALRAATNPKPLVAILSRETAKLGHGYLGLAEGSTCPKCGASVPAGDHAKLRSRCKAMPVLVKDRMGELVLDYVRTMQRFLPTHTNSITLLRDRASMHRAGFYYKKLVSSNPPVWKGLPPDLVDALADALVERIQKRSDQSEAIVSTNGPGGVLLSLLLAAYDPARIARVARAIPMSKYSLASSLVVNLLVLLPPGSEDQKTLFASIQELKDHYHYGSGPWWANLERDLENLEKGITLRGGNYSPKLQGLTHRVGKLGRLPFVAGREGKDDVEVNSLAAATLAFEALTSAAATKFHEGDPCGEPLFQAIPEPARLPLATVICKRFPTLFDFLILDEGHEYATDGSAQERAAHRLTSLGIPTMLMTGTIMNGYAESLFSNWWAVSRKFRQEFARDQRSAFVDRYGFRKVLLQEKEPSKRETQYGSVTDRVETTRKVIGQAPGVMPLFLLRHLLPVAVTLHKSDLAIDLPPCTQEPLSVNADPLVQQQYEHLKKVLLATIKSDMFSPRQGALFGQLSELPSYLDRATLDTGNGHDRAFVLRYPKETPGVGGHVVATVPLLPADHILAKEERMLDLVEAELAAGRNVLVFAWHIPVLPRLARLLADRLKQKVPILHADKVPTGKRQSWINKEVIGKGARVMVANPVTVQTGLNNLVHFHTEVWMENPACNPLVFRQAIGRVDRIGQEKPTKIIDLTYANTMQVQARDLLMRKVAVSVATDGLDPEAALMAAGVSEDTYLAGLSIGKQLYAMLTEAGGATRPPKRTVPSRHNPRAALTA